MSHQPVVTGFQVRPPTFPDGHWMNRFWAPLARGLLTVVGRFPFYRYVLRAPEETATLLADPAPVIFTCTHQDIFDCYNGLPRAMPGRRLAAMVSYSRDGNLSSMALRMLGYEIVRGSSSRGGGEALMMLRSCITSGSSVLMVSDGPKAPLGDVKPGIVRLASSSRAPVVPLRGWGLNRIRFERSWSKAAITLPFLPVVLGLGAPIHVPAEVEDARVHQVTIARALADLAAATSMWANGPYRAPFTVGD